MYTWSENIVIDEIRSDFEEDDPNSVEATCQLLVRPVYWFKVGIGVQSVNPSRPDSKVKGRQIEVLGSWISYNMKSNEGFNTNVLTVVVYYFAEREREGVRESK